LCEIFDVLTLAQAQLIYNAEIACQREPIPMAEMVSGSPDGSVFGIDD
jgi:hypothetical protein